MMEENLRRALLLSLGDWSTFVTRPLSAGLLAAAILEVIPRSLSMSNMAAALVLAGYLFVHLVEHTVSTHFHFGEETHHEEMMDPRVAIRSLAGLAAGMPLPPSRRPWVLHWSVAAAVILAGLMGAIVDPLDQKTMTHILVAETLLGKDDSA
jgi:hypothetical protein